MVSKIATGVMEIIKDVTLKNVVSVVLEFILQILTRGFLNILYLRINKYLQYNDKL